MKISALDLGVTTGLCFGESEAMPLFGSWDLRNGDRGRRGLKLMHRLSGHLDNFAPDVLYLEAPPPLAGMVQRGTNLDALQSLYGYDMVVRVVAHSRALRLEIVDAQKARYAFLGFKPRRGEGKAAVMNKCRALGWLPVNPNESDAGCVWSFAVGNEQPSAQAALGLGGE